MYRSNASTSLSPRTIIHSISQHLLGNLKASLVHAFFYAFSSTFLHAFFHTFFHSFLVSVIQKGSFNTYRIPEFIIGSEFGISKTGNFKIFYGFSNLWVIEQVGRNLILRICSSSLSGRRAFRRLISLLGWLPNIFLNVRSALGSKYFITICFKIL